MEEDAKEEIISMIEREATKRGFEFRRMRSGRGYQFSVGAAKGVVKLTEGSQKYPDIIWTGMTLKTLDELGERSFLIVIDEVSRNYLVIPFSEVRNWNRHNNAPLISATIRRIGGNYLVVPTKYLLRHVARLGSPDALNTIFENAVT